MRANTDTLNSLEHSAFRSRWQDGLIDVLGGLGVLWTGVAWTFDFAWGVPLVVPVLLVLWSGTRKSLVEPRIGRATFSRDRREKSAGASRHALWLGVGLLLCFLAFSLFDIRSVGSIGEWVRERIAALPLMLIGLMAVQAAIMTGLTRFFGYAAVFVGIATVATRYGMEPGLQMLLGGSVVFLCGAALFVRFLNRHPVRTHTGAAL